MQIRQTLEHEITPELHAALTDLRNACFPEHAKPRSYFKQLPHFRVLAFEGPEVVGHLGVDHRMISVGSKIFSIFGIIDLCVAAPSRGKGVASVMLERATALAQGHGIDFLFLAATDHRLYLKHGFRPVSTTLTWMRIHEHRTFGVAVERLENELMIKQTGIHPWPDEPVDLLGYLF